jgi:GrpB-like predicted nucleotidyltransferase (UPF0157 family)
VGRNWILVAVRDQPPPEFLTPPVRVNGPITLAEADPAWPEQFAREEERIRGAVGARALQIEHVGSTSVPGLAAKPIIDIVLVVADTADEAAYVTDLKAAGYVLHARDFHPTEHRLFTDHNWDVQVHVLTVGDPEVERMVLFRDWLRTHSEERDLYERTKREFAARRWAYVQDYADAKSSVVEGIIARGRADRETI